MDEVGLGKQLQAVRKQAGLTQQELCHKAGLSYSTLAKIERGAIKAPSIFTIQSIAAALGVTLAELMGDIAPKVPAKKRFRSKSGVRFVYFDINGCLVRFFHRAFTQIAADTGAPADLIETTFWHFNDTVCRGDMTVTDFNELLAEKLGTDKIDWLSYYKASVDPIEDMHELIRWASEHYDVGLLSNIMPGFIDSMLESKLLPDIEYASIVDSSKLGVIKPEPKIYEIAQAQANCEPSEILFVDDSRANLMAAEKFGWHVLWFDDYNADESAEKIKKVLEPIEEI